MRMLASSAWSAPSIARHESPERRQARTRPASKVTEVGRPPSHAASRAGSTARATMPDSRRATSASLGKRLTEATARMMPVIATTTSTSISVKPLFPVSDVGRIALASARAIRAQAEHVDLALHAGAQVLVVAAPRVLRHALEVAALLPVARHRIGGGLLRQRSEPLAGGGIAAVVEPVELEGLHDGADVGLRRDALRLVGPGHDARHADGGRDPEYGDHDKNLDEGETAARIHFPIIEFSWKMGSRMASTMASTTAPMKRIIAGSKSAVKAANRIAMSFCCWRAARSRASSRRPLVSPLAMRCTMTGGNAAVAPQTRASGMPSRTPRAALGRASRIGPRGLTPVPAPRARRV